MADEIKANIFDVNSFKRILPGLVVALVTGLVCLGIFNFLPNLKDFNEQIKGIVSVFVAISVLLSMSIYSRLRDRWLMARAHSLLTGLKLYIERVEKKNLEQQEEVELIEWIGDQYLIAKDCYAFSFSCIAFHTNSRTKEITCLMKPRPFVGIRDFGTVYLLPGGRFLGLRGPLNEELEKRVKCETGLEVKILPLHSNKNKDDRVSMPIPSYNPPDAGPVVNNLLAPPLIVMQQNRTQRNKIRGHLDFIYVGEVMGGELPLVSREYQLMSLQQLENQDESQLWPDMLYCIKKAYKEFADYKSNTEVG